METITTYFDALHNKSAHEYLTPQLTKMWEKYPNLNDKELSEFDNELLKLMKEFFNIKRNENYQKYSQYEQMIGGFLELTNTNHIAQSFNYFMDNFDMEYIVDVYINSSGIRNFIKKYIIENRLMDDFISFMNKEIMASIYNYTRTSMGVVAQNLNDKYEFITSMKKREKQFLEKNPEVLNCDTFYTINDIYEGVPDEYKIGIIL